MIFLGLDDTDVLDSPGTNKLARHLVAQLQNVWRAERITRHQLLEDPRVPCTRKNGCVAIRFSCSPGAAAPDASAQELICRARHIIQKWCPLGSDPGLCVIETLPTGAGPREGAQRQAVPSEIVAFGGRAQREFLRQDDARELARRHGDYLEGLGGSEDGVIGALAAVGLSAGENDGRITYLGRAETDLFDVSGPQPFDRLGRLGVEEVRRLRSDAVVTAGTVDVGKRLRPNLRRGRVILYVEDEPSTLANVEQWNAVRVV
jgi:tRNA(Ile2) C34 agmatinyltransferase TiaS